MLGLPWRLWAVLGGVGAIVGLLFAWRASAVRTARAEERSKTLAADTLRLGRRADSISTQLRIALLRYTVDTVEIVKWRTKRDTFQLPAPEPTLPDTSRLLVTAGAIRACTGGWAACEQARHTAEAALTLAQQRITADSGRIVVKDSLLSLRAMKANGHGLAGDLLRMALTGTAGFAAGRLSCPTRP